LTFTDPAFYYLLLPAVFLLYFPLLAAEHRWPALSGASAIVLIGAGVLLVAAAAASGPSWLTFAVIACHTVAYVADRRARAGESLEAPPLITLLYFFQFPLLVAGPIVRFRDFSTQLAKRAVGLGHFSYGVRRLAIGVIKVAVLSRVLTETAAPMFASAPATLTAPAAWLGACCAALGVYFLFSGYADIAIGIGRMIGFRYPENFRRPYTADSIREFWRRWNITLLTWLRDYVQLPIAGHDRPTPQSYAAIVLGFCIVGWWHGAGLACVGFGVYFGTLLALEAAGMERRVSRWSKPLRHAYVLVAVMVGWVIANAGADALGFLRAMLGLSAAPKPSRATDLSLYEWLVVVFSFIAAGPLIPALSRWRVGVDAAATSLLMMLAATALFVWRPVAIVLRRLPSGAGRSAD
jgi:alginate O-acetyltransferase complex protein AlgI